MNPDPTKPFYLVRIHPLGWIMSAIRSEPDTSEFYYVHLADGPGGDWHVWKEKFVAVGAPDVFWGQRINYDH